MTNEELIKKIENENSAIEMLNLKQEIIDALSGKKVKGVKK